MPAPLAVDKEQVRMLVAEYGSAEAARRCGIKACTVRQWSKRGGWTEGNADKASLASGFPTPAKLALAATLPESIRPVIVTGVTKPADAQKEILANESLETRSSLSRAALQLAKQAETAGLDQAGDVLQVGKLAALTHSWEQSGGSSVSINLLIQ
jgi:hypothetical protein